MSAMDAESLGYHFHLYAFGAQLAHSEHLVTTQSRSSALFAVCMCCAPLTDHI
jgi:hypothetical protein